MHHPNYSKAKDINEISDISKKYKIKPGHRMEPIIFEPEKKIKLSRSTYKVNSYIDFKPYKETFKQFRYYMVRFLKDIHDPHYVGNLYNINRPKGSPPVKLGQVTNFILEHLLANKPPINVEFKTSTCN